MSRNFTRFVRPVNPDGLSEFFDSFDFKINGFGMQRQENDELHMHGFLTDYLLLYIKDGRLKVFINEREFLCEKDSFLLFEPFVFVDLEVLDPENLRCYRIHFNILPEHRGNIFFRVLLGNRGNMFLARELPRVGSLFANLQHGVDSGMPGMRSEAEILLRMACLHMMSTRWEGFPHAVDQATAAGFNRKLDIVNEGIQYIHKHQSNPVRVSELSNELNVSESYLYKCFMEVIQIPPSRYILQHKIQSSIELMLTTSMTIEQVGVTLGFGSLHHFSKNFKSLMGSSPRNYIARMLAE